LDIQWQQAQALFQIVITFDLAASILVGRLRSVEMDVQEIVSKTQSDLSKLANDVLIVKFSFDAGEWLGPNVFEELWAEYNDLRTKFEPVQNKIWELSQKLGRERSFYIIYAVLTGIQFTLLLFYSTLHPLQSLPLRWIWSFGFTGLLPSLIGLARIPWWDFKFAKLRAQMWRIDLDASLVINVASAKTAGADNKPNVQIHRYKFRRGLYEL
jgi:hypothetical protein